MGRAAKAETILRNAVKRTPATIKPKPKPRGHFIAWTVNSLLEQYRDPRAILLEIASTDTVKLAEQAQCSLLDAQMERRLCAQAVLPYVAQKLPVQVDMRHTKAIHLNIVTDEHYNELAALAHADDAHDSDLEAVQLIQGQVIEHTSTTPTTAETRTSHNDAHLPDEQPKNERAHEAQTTTHNTAPVGGEHRGLGTDETEQSAQRNDVQHSTELGSRTGVRPSVSPSPRPPDGDAEQD